MFDTLSLFHFIRPYWLIAFIPVIVIIIGLFLKSTRKNQWNEVIDEHLLNHLLIGQKKIQQSNISPLLLLAISLLLALFALAGPTWVKKPLPVFETEISKVIILDLSLSMEATDIKPSRLIRARHKINDLLLRTNEGQVALIVYAGDAFVISPLTTDSKTILTMIPPLAPSLMPVLGSEPQAAFALADELLTNAGVFSGQIIWITDGIDDNDYGSVATQLKSSRHQISILAVGTHEGAPIPLPDAQGFLKNSQGGIILPTLNMAPLEQLADISNGTVTRLTADDQDIDKLLSSLIAPQEFVSTDDDLEMDTWIEFGPWLLIPVILVAALAFRKGLVIALALTFIPALPSNTYAAEQESSTESTDTNSLEGGWKDLWQTSDQQAADAYQNNNHQLAADLFEHKDWKSAALYRSGQFNAASDLLSNGNTATTSYNRANALAHSGKLEESIASYDDALKLFPDMEDAQFNKAIVEKMLQKQQQEEKQQQEQQSDQQEDSEQQQQDGEQQESEEESEEQGEQDSKPQESEQEAEEKEQEQTDLEQMTEAEREQVLEQWLRKIKDDPGGLLRRKMYMEYQRRQQQGKQRQDKGEKVW